jgi:colanic acid biosynthesis glycosyl transferase WcaI
MATEASTGLPVVFINQVPSRPLLDVAQALAERGHDVTLLAAASRLSRPLRGVATVGLCEYDARTYASRLRSWLWFTAQAAWFLLATPASAVVVVCTNPPLMPYAAVIVGLIRRFTCVVRVLDVYPDVLLAAGFGRRSWLVRCLDRWNRWTFARCGAITTLGETMGYTVAAYAGTCWIKVIPEWIDSNDTGTKTVFPHHKRRFTVLAAGNVGLTHDLTPLADACRYLADQHVDIIITADDASSLRATFSGCSNVHFVPRLDDAEYSRALLDADVAFISVKPAAAGASFPSRVIAYLSHGLPVIAVTDRPSDLATLIEKGPCGVVIAPDSGGEGVSRAIREMIDRPSTLADFSQAAVSLAVTRFTAERCRNEFVALVETTGMRRQSHHPRASTSAR